MSTAGAQRWQERVPDEALAEESASAERAAERAAHYDELIRFEKRILAQMLELARSLSADALREVEASNIEPLRALIEELRRRRDAWAERRDSTPS
jgi:hypothetical protein